MPDDFDLSKQDIETMLDSLRTCKFVITDPLPVSLAPLQSVIV